MCIRDREERDRALGDLTWYSDHWKSNMHLVQSRMHPSLWLMKKKGKGLKKKISMAEPVHPDRFAETHTWIKGQVKGRIALFVDDMLQTGAKESNVELLKALEKEMDSVKARAPGAYG
eukprot:12901757-Prorocentrum_lima.AAC.1